jgi:hypothetical protein
VIRLKAGNYRFIYQVSLIAGAVVHFHENAVWAVSFRRDEVLFRACQDKDEAIA